MLMKQVIKSHNQVALCIQNEQVPTPEKKTLKKLYFSKLFCSFLVPYMLLLRILLLFRYVCRGSR